MPYGGIRYPRRCAHSGSAIQSRGSAIQSRGSAVEASGGPGQHPGSAVSRPGSVVRLPASAVEFPRNEVRLPRRSRWQRAARYRSGAARRPTLRPGCSSAGRTWAGRLLTPAPGCSSAGRRMRTPGRLRVLRRPTVLVARSRVAVRRRGRRPVRAAGPAMTCVSPGAPRPRPASAGFAAVPRSPHPGTSPASSEPSRAFLADAGRRQDHPHDSPGSHYPEPAFPGWTRRMPAGSAPGPSGSYGHRRQRGRPSGYRRPSGCRRPSGSRRLEGRRWPFAPAASRVPRPLRPTSSICLNSTQTCEEGRSTSSGATLFKRVRRRPTLPRGPPRSTIGAEGLNFRVRNGTGCFPFAITAETLLRCHRPAS